MHQTRTVLIVAAALAASGCASEPEQSRPDARDLTLATAPTPDAVLGPAELIRPGTAPRATAAISAAPAPRPR
ncbi:MAG: hypothetical protein ACREOC_17460, partial [Gemmatimonadales bacterium]